MPTESDKQNPLNRDDLFLLMKSYENSVSLNTLVNSKQDNILEKQEILLSKLDSLSSIVQPHTIKHDEFVKMILADKDTLNKIMEMVKDRKKDNIELEKSLIETPKLLKTLLDNNKEMTNKIYLMGAGLIVIILTLIKIAFPGGS